MCGRFREVPDVYLHALAEQLGADWRCPEAPERYEVAPTNHARVIVREGGTRYVDTYHWGLIVPWAEAKGLKQRPFNARADGVASKPFFRSAFGARRCLVPVRGFWEWQGPKGAKIRTWITSPDGSPLVFAGLWEEWRPADAEPVRSFTIITTEPSEIMAGIHDRMPAILTGDERAAWLDPAARGADLQRLLRPYAGELAVEAEDDPLGAALELEL